MSPRPRVSARRGAAIVELAVCLPVVILLVLGAIEGASLLFARQAMVQTAYEAAVVAVRPNGTNAAATAAATQVVKGRRLNGLQLTFSPPDVSQASPGTPITVTATVPSAGHRLLGSRIFRVDNISARAVMIKE